MKKRGLYVLMLCFCLLVSGCGKKEKAEETQAKAEVNEELKETKEEEEQETGLEINTDDTTDSSGAGIEEDNSNGITIVIDPGHTAVMAGGQEPVGPGASEYKAADTLGTSGAVTGIPEYEFTLTLGLKLRTELEARGYTVVMTRETSDLSLSCIERANIMNNSGASACVRIHADGSESSSAQGAMGICITPSNPYIASMYEQSRRLSDCVLNHFVASTGSSSRGVWETDTMSGNNWSQIPVTLLECGFMTNPEEDQKLADENYQNLMVQGIADGIDEFCGQ